MGISTITAARIYAGQSAGEDGESHHLAMDDLPYSALSKTYSHNFQIADSAGTAVAMVSGVKTLSGVLGVDSNVSYGNCATVAGNEVDTLFELAARAGLSTGLVSTARITHATPGAAELIVRAESLIDRLELLLPAPPPSTDWKSAVAFRWRKRGAHGYLQPIDVDADGACGPRPDRHNARAAPRLRYRRRA